MNEHSKNIIIFLSVIFSLILAFLLWDYIKLPYSNPEEIVGVFSEFHHSKYNDALRCVIFIGLPSITFFILFLFFKRENCILLKEILFYETEEKIPNNNYLLIIFSLFFILIAIFQFLSIDFPLDRMDMLHEGNLLGGAYNNLVNDSFWISSYLEKSIFYDILIAKISWLISGEISFGSFRVFILFLNLLTEIFIIIFCINLCKKFKLKKNDEIFFFVILTIFILYINGRLTHFWWPIRFRDIPLLLFLILSLKLFTSNKQNFIICYFLGTLSVLSMLWSLDKGIYLNVSLMFTIFLLLINRNNLKTTFIIIGVFSGWLIFYNIIGDEEFRNFITNSLNVLNDQQFGAGLIYPKPFFFGEILYSSRGTKNLIIILINSLLIISIILSKKNKIPKNTKLFLLLFFLLSYLNYQNAISRSDSWHMRQGIFFHLYLSLIFLIYYIIRFKTFFLEKKIQIIQKKYFIIILLILLILPQTKFSESNFYKAKNFKNRLTHYIKLDDNAFLDHNYQNLLTKLDIILKQEDCIQVFTYDAALPYLLRKKSCTKFYQIWSLVSKKSQFKFIEELKLNKTKFILVDGPYKRWEPTVNKRFRYIHEYLNKNYMIKEELYGWRILNIIL